MLAVLLAGVAGLLFSPIAARLRGIYLGIASLGLVFVGQHVLFNAEALTGGFNGRNVPAFTLLGLRFDDVPGETLYVLGVPFGREEKLWYLGLAVTGRRLPVLPQPRPRAARPGAACDPRPRADGRDHGRAR